MLRNIPILTRFLYLMTTFPIKQTTYRTEIFYKNYLTPAFLDRIRFFRTILDKGGYVRDIHKYPLFILGIYTKLFHFISFILVLMIIISC